MKRLNKSKIKKISRDFNPPLLKSCDRPEYRICLKEDDGGCKFVNAQLVTLII